jgi:hypothetical protein
MLQVPVALSVAIITKELEVTLCICVPLSVVLPPLGNVMETVSPCWKLLPKTVTRWSTPLAVGVEGDIDVIEGVETNGAGLRGLRLTPPRDSAPLVSGAPPV